MVVPVDSTEEDCLAIHTDVTVSELHLPEANWMVGNSEKMDVPKDTCKHSAMASRTLVDVGTGKPPLVLILDIRPIRPLQYLDKRRFLSCRRMRAEMSNSAGFLLLRE